MPASSSIDEPARRAALASALFLPQRIALIGATTDRAGLGSRPQRVLHRHGYAGTIVLIGPAQEEIDGDRAYPSLSACPSGIEHAFVMAPPAAVPRLIGECCAAGVAVTTVFSAGFAELGRHGKRRQDAMVAMARAGGMRLLGPNSLGIVNVPGAVALSANAVFEHETLRPGGLSVISQSGSMLGALTTRAQERGLGFSKLIAVGNECDLCVGELTHLLVDDPDTRAILLFLETLRDAEVLGAAARRAYAAGKPVIALLLGRSAAGREVATTHTGAMVGAEDAAAAFCTANGILRVEMFEALFETAQLVLGHRPPTSRRVATLTVSGGAAALVVDRLGLAGIELVPPSAEVIAQLAAEKIRIAPKPLIDLPMGRADGGTYASILSALMRSDHCDAVVAVQGSNAAYSPESIQERVLAAERGTKPLAVFVAPHAGAALRRLQSAGVAGFRTPESCADAVRAYLDWRAPTAPVGVSDDEIALIDRAVQAAGRGMLNEHAASHMLAAIGIPIAPACVMQRPSDRVPLEFPVAAKILSADIAHKSVVGGVVLDIPDVGALRGCVQSMLERVHRALPQARIDGVLVQSMQRGLAEAIIGYRCDPVVGPVIMVGAGGVLAELCPGRAVRLAPVSVAVALEMIANVPGLAPLRGWRGRPAGDVEALARAVQRLSLLAVAATAQACEAEINPLIVRADGVIAVDALVHIAVAHCPAHRPLDASRTRIAAGVRSSPS